jgi:hypothetical protein
MHNVRVYKYLEINSPLYVLNNRLTPWNTIIIIYYYAVYIQSCDEIQLLENKPRKALFPSSDIQLIRIFLKYHHSQCQNCHNPC